MEGKAVLGRIVEALHSLELVIAIVVEARVPRDRLPDLVLSRVKLIQRAGVGQLGLGTGSPGLFARAPVSLFEEARHLRQRICGAAELGLLPATDLLELLVELLLLYNEGHVLLAEDLHLGAYVAQEDLVLRAKLVHGGRFQHLL